MATIMQTVAVLELTVRPEQKEKRYSDECRRSETNELPFGQPKQHFGFYFRQILWNGYIRQFIKPPLMRSEQGLLERLPVLNRAKHSKHRVAHAGPYRA